jgi:DNA-binding transcriptional LysR family regulator
MQSADRIARRVKLQDLHVLMTVIAAGSMRKAAVQLHTTQPSVSRSIAELEAAVGVRLLDRNPDGVVPTQYGRALLDGGVAIFDDLRQTVKSIEQLADPEIGDVRITSGYHLAPTFVSTVVERMSRTYPRIVFHVFGAETTAFMHRQLHERATDLVVGRDWNVKSDPDLSYERLFDDTYYVVSSTRHPWARRRRIELDELKQQLWVLPEEQSPPGRDILAALAADGLGYPPVAVFAILPEVRARLLATGRFLTMFPTSLLTTSPIRSEIKVLPVKFKFRTPVGIVTLKNRTLSPVVKLFAEHARDVAKSFDRGI